MQYNSLKIIQTSHNFISPLTSLTEGVVKSPMCRHITYNDQ